MATPDSEHAARRPPPKKRKGVATGPRRFNGEAMDVAATADGFFGGTKKTVYSLVARRRIPFRRMGGRIVILRSELVADFQALDGCSVEEALKNAQRDPE